MNTESKAKYNAHLIRIIIALVVVVVLGIIARILFVPGSMGQYGHYRGADIVDQKNVMIRLGTNESCFTCHKLIRTIHKEGVHKTVSCEVCHGPFGNHIADGMKIGALPIKQGQEISHLCLRCHNKIIQARPRESIRMVGMPEHLEIQQVKTSHNCNQCHMVHDPLLWIRQAKEMMGLTGVRLLKSASQ